MRHLAIGDVHGCWTALKTLLDFASVGDDDVLVMLGDYVDRGPQSCDVVEWLASRKGRGEVVALRGNHEVMMLAARDRGGKYKDWLEVGGGATLASYSPFEDDGKLSDVWDSHWRFLENGLRPYYETETHIFVHAGLDAKTPLHLQPDVLLYWEPFKAKTRHFSGKTMVCGHTRQKSGEPGEGERAVCIDTGVSRGGWLTCLDAATGRCWQANQLGATRMLQLNGRKK